MKTAACLLLLSTVFSSAGRAASAASPSTGAQARIRASLAAWTEAANRGDWQAASTVWAPDLVGWAPEGADDTYAREMAGAAGAKPGKPSTTYALEINEVLVDSAMAVVRDTWTMTENAGTAGAKVSRFRSFEVWRLQPDGEWKIARWIDGPIAPVRP